MRDPGIKSIITKTITTKSETHTRSNKGSHNVAFKLDISWRSFSRLLIGTIIFSFCIFVYPNQVKAADDLTEVRSLLQTTYVEPVSSNVLLAPTIKDILNRLGDPYTTYFGPSEYTAFEDFLKNQTTGIGVQVDKATQGAEVLSVIPDSPAEKAGLKPGDIITRAEQYPLAGLSLDAATNLIKGPVGSSVNIVVLRGSKLLFFNITRQPISQPEVTSELLDNHIAYLKISVFGGDIPELFAKQAAALKEQGADSWIIDLRENPGGYVNSAIKLAGYFIPGKVVVQIRDRSDTVTKLTAPVSSFHIEGPIVVLTDKNSASASEIFAAALKDQGAAEIMGAKTFGKGSVQGIYNFQDGAALKMTIAHFYSPDGTTIDHVGVTPNLEVNPDDAEEDAVQRLTSK